VMDPRYYQPMHDNSGAYAAHVARLQNDPSYRAQVFSEIDRVGGEGTNVSNLATDNASGDVAQRSMGNQTLAYTAPNKESFLRKDVRPDVHGAGVVPATAAWAQGLATAPPVDASRAGVAQALMAQQGGAPPVMNADDQQQAALPPAQRQVAPQMQIAQAPPAPQAGYVMPDFGNLKQPGMIQPSAREYELDQKIRAMTIRGNPYATTGRDAQELAFLRQNREYEQARQNEAWKEQLQAKRAWDLEQQKQKAGAAENIARTEREQAQANAARLVDPDGKMVMGPDGVLRPPRTEGVANQLPTAKLNEADKKTVSFYSTMKLAEEQLKGKEQILADGLRDEAAGKIPFVGNALMRRQYRMAKNAAEMWVDQYNIHQTGAASRDNEWDRRFRNTIPRYGDDPTIIEQKRQAREGIMQGLYTGLGTQSGRAVADATVKDNITRLQNTRDTLNKEMQDKFPDAVRGTVKTRIRNGKKETRVFDGKNWLESTDGSD